MAISAIIKSANAQHRPPFAACRIRVQRRRSAARKKKKKKLSTYLVCSSIGKLSSQAGEAEGRQRSSRELVEGGGSGSGRGSFSPGMGIKRKINVNKYRKKQKKTFSNAKAENQRTVE